MILLARCQPVSSSTARHGFCAASGHEAATAGAACWAAMAGVEPSPQIMVQRAVLTEIIRTEAMDRFPETAPFMLGRAPGGHGCSFHGRKEGRQTGAALTLLHTSRYGASKCWGF